jgi:myosin heavy subunit
MSQPRYARIQGVNFPTGIPRDFANQIQDLLKKHNQMVDDLLAYHETIVELHKSVEFLRSENENLQTQNAELQQSYDSLKELSEKVASKYEAQQNRSPARPPVSSIKSKIEAYRLARPAKAVIPSAPAMLTGSRESDDEPTLPRATSPAKNTQPKSKRQPTLKGRRRREDTEPESSDEETVLEVMDGDEVESSIADN